MTQFSTIQSKKSKIQKKSKKNPKKILSSSKLLTIVPQNMEARNHLSPTKATLIQRRGFTWLRNEEVWENIAPLPDMLSFFTVEFQEEFDENNLSRENTPYFICKYFNPKFFDEDGNRLSADVFEHRQSREYVKTDRDVQYDRACDVVIENKKTILQGAIDPTFIYKKKMNDMDIIVLLYVFSGKTSAVVNGFITCNDHNLLIDEKHIENVLYIDVVGSRRRKTRNKVELEAITFGSKLIKDIEKFARSKHYLGLTLSSLTYVINYYRKLGFRHLPMLSAYETMYEDPDICQASKLFAETRHGIHDNIDDYIFTEYIVSKYHINAPLRRILEEMKLYWEQRGLFARNMTEEKKLEYVEIAYNTYKLKFPDTLDGRSESNIGKYIHLLTWHGFSSCKPNYKNRKIHRAITNYKRFFQIPFGNRNELLRGINRSSAGLEGWYGVTDPKYGGLDMFPFERSEEQDEGFKMTLQFVDSKVDDESDGKKENHKDGNDYIPWILAGSFFVIVGVVLARRHYK